MNKLRPYFFLAMFGVVLCGFAGVVRAQAQATSGTDQFFVVSSIEKSALVLLRPTEITAVINVTDKTQIVDETNKPIKVGDLRTGDTIFVTYASGAGGTLTASHVRKGMMTVAELRKRYVPSLPATAGQTGPGH
jgi:hypothetical protein